MVSVSDVGPPLTSFPLDESVYHTCANHPGVVRRGYAVILQCDQAPIIGRFVYIHIMGSNETLALCEVKVYTPGRKYPLPLLIPCMPFTITSPHRPTDLLARDRVSKQPVGQVQSPVSKDGVDSNWPYTSDLDSTLFTSFCVKGAQWASYYKGWSKIT